MLQQRGLFHFQSDLRWSEIVIFNTSIHIFEIGRHLECDILTKMADILQNCPFLHVILQNLTAKGLILLLKCFKMIKNSNFQHLHWYIWSWRPFWMWYLNQDGRHSSKWSVSVHHLTKILQQRGLLYFQMI